MVLRILSSDLIKIVPCAIPVLLVSDCSVDSVDTTPVLVKIVPFG